MAVTLQPFPSLPPSLVAYGIRAEMEMAKFVFALVGVQVMMNYSLKRRLI